MTTKRKTPVKRKPPAKPKPQEWPMSVEEDIGGLKADMATVKDQTSQIFKKMDDISTVLTVHTTNLASSIKDSEDKHEATKAELDKKINKSLVLGIGSGAGLGAGIGGAGFLHVIKGFFNG